MTAYVPCPRCGTHDPERVKFTWWGGMLGPKLLSHVKCQRCGNAYNGKSGKSNTNGIIIYSLVAMVLAFGLFFVLVFAAVVLPALMK